MSNIFSNTKRLTMAVGCYTGNSPYGIVTYRLDKHGRVFNRLHSAKVENASFLTIAPDGKHLYAVSENGPDDSLVNALEIDADSCEMHLVNSIPSCGWSPCHIVGLGTSLAITNYGSGNLALCGINADGSIAPCHQLLDCADSLHSGDSRTHFTLPLPGNRVVVSNLGHDCLHVMRISCKEPLRLELQHTVKLPRGCGPRHMAFNNFGTMLYVVTEKSNEVMAFAYSPETGGLKLLQSIKASNGQMAAAADLHLSDDGRFLYASVRREADGIAIFGINDNGLLEIAGYQPTRLHPRSFAITPDGTMLLVACRDSNSIEVYRRDHASGLLTKAPIPDIAVSQPVCIKWMP